MESTNRQLAEQVFAPLRVSFGAPRPDGSSILSLLDDADVTAYSRVLSKVQQQDSLAFAQCLEDIRQELAVRSGNIPTEMRKALKEHASVLSYHNA